MDIEKALTKAQQQLLNNIADGRHILRTAKSADWWFDLADGARYGEFLVVRPLINAGYISEERIRGGVYWTWRARATVTTKRA